LGAALLLCAASIFVTVKRLGLETGQLDLISPKHPLIRLNEELRPFRGRDAFTVVVEAPSPRQAVAFIQDLASRLRNQPQYFKEVFYRIDPSTFRPWALLYLSAEDLRRLADRLREHRSLLRGLMEEPTLERFLKLVNQEMARRMIGGFFTDFLKEEEVHQDEKSDPMDLRFLMRVLEDLGDSMRGRGVYRSPWPLLLGEDHWDPELEGYVWIQGKRYLLATVTPRHEKETFNKARLSLERLRSSIQEVLRDHPGLEVGVTGQEALKTDEMTVALGDMQVATWMALGAICLLMILFLRTVRRPLIEMISLAVGMTWTFGWTALTVGHLNILSMVFAPLLSGLGVDYGIHWFSRFEEEEQRVQGGIREVIERVTERSGPGILLAGLTAALSFLPLVLTGFKGLVELGMITGMGVLFTLLADFTVLPALSLLMAGRRQSRTTPTTRGKTDLFRLTPKTSRCILAAAVIFCALSIWGSRWVHFDLNPLHLQAKDAESVIWETKLLRGSKRSVIYASLLSPNRTDVLEKTRKLEELPTVAEVQSAFSLLPKGQEPKLAILKGLRGLFPPPTQGLEGPPHDPQPDVPALKETLSRILFKMREEEAGRWGAGGPLREQMAEVRLLIKELLPRLEESPGDLSGLREYERRFREDLVRMLEILREGIDSRPMTVDDLPPLIKDRYIQDGKYLIRVYPKEFIWDREPLNRFVRDIRTVDPMAAGDPVTLHDFTFAFRQACIKASLYALTAIGLLLLVTFRSILSTLLALLPLLLGTLWTVGLMGLVGIHFNLANSIFIPLIVGAGVEYGVIILSRWREGRMEPGRLPLSTAKGVILAALTTTVGFGSLMISRHQGIFSLGFLAFSGSLCVLVAAVAVLPALLLEIQRGRRNSNREVAS